MEETALSETEKKRLAQGSGNSKRKKRFYLRLACRNELSLMVLKERKIDVGELNVKQKKGL